MPLHLWVSFPFKVKNMTAQKIKIKELVIIHATPSTSVHPALAAITESYLCFKHVTKEERGAEGSWGASACSAARCWAPADSSDRIWMLRSSTAMRSRRDEWEERRKDWAEAQSATGFLSVSVGCPHIGSRIPSHLSDAEDFMLREREEKKK